MNYINGNDLYHMFEYGASFITRKRQLLNEINVFPVPDGDTGNNLAVTLQTIVTESTKMDSFHDMIETMSNAALLGARGNSGMIFAQFVNGFRLASKGLDEVSLEQFAQMANESALHTYRSLSHPVEGTMLTVIKAWAKSLLDIYQISESIKAFFLNAFQKAKVALDQTKEQLDILKKRNLVDSGALGFVTFLEGVNSFFNSESLMEEEIVDLNIEHDHSDDEVGLYRYCTEGLVKHNEQNEKDILNALNPFGDSLIVAVGATMFRVHIHTNEPAIVFQTLRQFGHIMAQKVDDMAMDIKMKKSHRDSVIVTDSICDIDQSYLLEHDVAVIPTNVLIENASYMDKISINNEVLLDMIEQGVEYPTTATPGVRSIRDLFEKLLTIYQHVLVISVSSKLSATYDIIHQEIETLANEGKHIIHVDSLTNSAGEGLLVKHAVEMLEDGKSIDDIKMVLDEEKTRTEILVCLETFKYAMLGGRLPKAVGKIGMALGIRPIMSIDDVGKGAAFGFARSQKGITKKIVKHIEKDMAERGIKQYALVHCLNEPLVKAYQEMFTKLLGKEPAYIAEVSSATAIHSGKGSVAIAYIKEKE